jgi:uncharacterized membrane protein (DUF2068 family)
MRLIHRSGAAGAPALANRSVRAESTEPADAGARRWGLVLVLFMRLLACVWIAQGLVQWMAMLIPHESVLDRASVQWAAAVVFFAVLDPVAAVGLWLVSSWGGVIWFIAAAAQIIATVAIPGLFSPIWIGVNSLLIGLYFLLTWLAARSARPKRSRRA